MPLNITVIGAGIGGLCVSVALQQAGHNVEIVEKSRFVGETGAALLVTPNGSRVLQRLGFSFDRAMAVQMTRWEVLDGLTLASLNHTELADAEKQYGAPIYTMHRADLHNELLRLAQTDRGDDLKGSLVLKLGKKVVSADSVNGIVTFDDGSTTRADLIIGADGLHSVMRRVVLGDETPKASPSGMRAFRFQLPTSAIAENDHFKRLSKIKGRGSTVLADTKELSSERHLVWYDCHGGQIQNFVGIHTSVDVKSEDLKDLMLREFGHFHPDIVGMLRDVSEVSDWPLPIFEPFNRWHRDRALIIGDAAHPMLPFGGQGANQAIEDAGALGALFTNVTDVGHIPRALDEFDKVRRLRASRVQTLSRVRLGKEKQVESQLRKYTESPNSEVPTSFDQRYKHDFGFDVYKRCREVQNYETQFPASRVKEALSC